ncbi:MAG: hypothetical protein ABII93_06625 [Chrysiogenia bacterium]
MNVKKLFLTILAISIISVSGNAVERKKSLPLKELQYPKSPSYVPFPYPKSRDEIIADLKYAIKLHHEPGIGDKKDERDRILLKLLEENSGVSIAEIEKVMNRTSIYPDEFSYFIALKDNDGNEVARLSLMASGLYSGGVVTASKKIKFKESFRIKKETLRGLSIFVNPSEVKKMERIFMGNNLAPYPFSPTWEIVTKDNSIYYLDYNNYFYKLRNEIRDVKKKGLTYKQYTSSKDERVVYDSLNDKILFLEKLKKLSFSIEKTIQDRNP